MHVLSVLFRWTLKETFSYSLGLSLPRFIKGTSELLVKPKASGGKHEASVKQLSRVTGWMRDSRSALASCLALTFTLAYKMQKNNACSLG